MDALRSAIAFLAVDHRCETAFTLLATALLVFPIFTYVAIGWRANREDIDNSITNPAKRIYLDRFRNFHTASDDEASERFAEMYYRRFGRRYFVCPTILIILIILVLASLVAEFAIDHSVDAAAVAKIDHIWKSQLQLNPGAAAAIAGAYMWVVSDFISRSRRLDFSPADIMWGALRLVIATPLGLSIGTILKDDVVPFIAFALGAFPLTTIIVMLRELANKQLGLQVGPTEQNPLRQIDGIDKDLVDRLANEDINSVAQLAYCDPIQLTMRTNLTFNAVVDLVGQSLAWIYLGNKISQLRPLGIRGAYEVRQLIDDRASQDGNLQRPADAIVPAIAGVLGLDGERVWFVLRQIAYDPYTDFIYSTWSAPPQPPPPAPPA